jgi:hypothetical protein
VLSVFIILLGNFFSRFGIACLPIRWKMKANRVENYQQEAVAHTDHFLPKQAKFLTIKRTNKFYIQKFVAWFHKQLDVENRGGQITDTNIQNKRK